MKLLAIPAFADNYIWLVHDGVKALVVDPGDAQVVLDTLQQLGLQLVSILVTHHHADHTGGVAALRQATHAHVVGPAHEPMPEPIERVSEGAVVNTALGLAFAVMHVPGHTAGHIAYFCQDFAGAPLLFCGDTLFSAGCGRLFEGTPAQMLDSLTRLAALPASTQVCCTHEYTLSNLKFAQAVEPSNPHVRDHLQHCQALRERALPTLPSTLALEWQINPFLRTGQAAVAAAAHAHDASMAQQSGVFATLRHWKNTYR